MKKNLFLIAIGAMVSVATLAQNGNHTGKHLHLDGATQYLKITDTVGLNYNPAGNGLSITFWVNDSSATNARLISNTLGSGGGSTGYDYFVSAGKIGPNVRYGVPGVSTGGNPGGNFTTVVTDYYNNWHHIAITYDPANTSLHIYVDGVLLVRSPSTDVNAAFGDVTKNFSGSRPDICFGVLQAATFANYWKGDVDDIRFYSGVLSETQVQADMTASVNATTPNLLAAYDFEDATTTTAPNVASSGSGYDATLVGNPVLNSDPAPLQPVTPAHSLTLDGTTNYMKVLNSATVNAPDDNSFTLTCWAKLDNSSTNKRIISKRLGTAGFPGFEFITSGTMQYGVNARDANNNNLGPSFSTATIGGSWHHLAMVIDRAAGTCSIYIDGVLSQSKTGLTIGNTVNTQDLLIGAYNDGTSASPSAIGQIDDIRLWSKAFTQSDIQADMTASVTGPATNLLAAWDFENITGNAVPDISGNGNTGTLVDINALPVTISNFSGHYSGASNSVSLQWNTANVVNIQSVVLEYSTDAKRYQPIYTTTPDGSETVSYSFTHQLNNITGTHIYYRLKIVDQDGSISYNNNVLHFSLSQIRTSLHIAPNPVGHKISVETNLSGTVNITVYDIAGRSVLHQTEDSGSFTLDISALSQGIYILKANNSAGQESAKFIKK